MIKVKSSIIHSVDYNKEDKVLHIKFNTNAEYFYLDVPEEVYNEMLKTSVGSYFHKKIKGIYEFIKGK